MKYKIYCINLYERLERYNFIKKQFEKYDLDVKFIRNNRHPKGGRYGCFKSHIQVMKDAYDNNLDYCLIMEDDFYIYDDPKSKINEIISFMKKYDSNILFSQERGLFYVKKCIEQNFYVGSVYGKNCYFISKKFIHISLNNYKKYIGDWHFDRYYNEIFPTNEIYFTDNVIGKSYPFGLDNDYWFNFFIINILQYNILKYTVCHEIIAFWSIFYLCTTMLYLNKKFCPKFLTKSNFYLIKEKINKMIEHII